MVLAAGGSLQAPKSSTNARFRCLWGAVNGLPWRWQPEEAYKRRNRARMLDFGACGGWSMDCRGGGSQRKLTSAEIEHECSISVLVGGGRWVVVAMAARGSLQAPKSSTNA